MIVPTIPYSSIDADLGEAYTEDEEEYAYKCAELVGAGVAAQPQGEAHRDVHAKNHGVQRAEFRVLPDLPDHLAQGLFVPGQVYQAYLRFSNGTGDPMTKDDSEDGRGLAIKLLDVPGEKLFEPDRDATTHDFIMINHPFFFVSEPKKYYDLVKLAGSMSALATAKIPFAVGLKTVKLFKENNAGKISNPLQVRYYSGSAYRLGAGPDRMAVKYSVRPASDRLDPLPDNPRHDYLREAIADTLRSSDVTMRFRVQPRTSDHMSVEDTMTIWDEDEAPFYDVATIVIPQQDFDTPELNALGENMSFNVWHALPEHKPLGAMNRIRKVVYHQISQIRHDRNGLAPTEP